MTSLRLFLSILKQKIFFSHSASYFQYFLDQHFRKGQVLIEISPFLGFLKDNIFVYLCDGQWTIYIIWWAFVIESFFWRIDLTIRMRERISWCFRRFKGIFEKFGDVQMMLSLGHLIWVTNFIKLGFNEKNNVRFCPI